VSMFDKLKQLQALKQQADEVKARMDNISVRGESHGIEVYCTANRKVTRVVVPEAMRGSARLEEHICQATNQALTSAEKVFESEMRSLAGGLLNMPGLS
jgi:DNA-binding protein YbaB